MKIQKDYKHILFRENLILLFEGSVDNLQVLVDGFIYEFHKLEKANGLKMTLKIFKEFSRVLSRLCLGQIFTFDQSMIWLKTTRGIPNILLPYEFLTQKDINHKRFILTLAGYYKLFKLDPDKSVTTVTDSWDQPNTVLKQIDEMDPYLPRILADFRMDTKPSADLPIFVTPKAGASGPLAMGLTGVRDLKSLQSTGTFPHIDSMMKVSYDTYSYQIWKDTVSNTLDYAQEQNIEGSETTARLHFIAEAGGKTRVICIPDIWSQICLKPIHDKIMNKLKGIPEDGTSSHNQIGLLLKEWTKTEKMTSYDLTAATDRLPVLLQELILRRLFGKSFASVWKAVISDRNIECDGRFVRYSVGQPMGFLSSWAMLALTHHVIIRYCKLMEGKPSCKYAIIGDDMTVSDPRVASRYKQVMTNLGVGISLQKSVLPDGKYPAGEIAKRLFVSGCEISPVPAIVLAQANLSLNGFLEFVQVLDQRDYLSDGPTPGTLDRARILSTFFEKNKERSNLSTRCYLCFPGPEVLDLHPVHNWSYQVNAPLSGLTSPWSGFSLEDIRRFYSSYLQREAWKRFDHLAKTTNSFMRKRQKRINEEYCETSKRDLKDEIPLISLYIQSERENIEEISWKFSELRSGDFPEFFERLLSAPTPADSVWYSSRRDRARSIRAAFLEGYLDYLTTSLAKEKSKEESK